MQNNQKYLYILGLLFVFTLGIYATKWWYGSDEPKRKEEAQILLEHTKNVSKLVTLEGYFSEIYSEEDTKNYYLFYSTKRALIKVKAKVSAGYDLSNMKMETDVTQKILRISNIPQPSIISIDADISYYDIANGVFNQFTKDDYTRLYAKAKELITNQASNSDFMNKVKAQGIQHFDALKVLAQSMGWKVVFENSSLPIAN